MIKSVTAINSRKKSLKMNLTTPEESGILITSINGLEPPKADISMVTGSIIDGSFYNSAHANSRNIVLELRYIENGLSIEAIRHLVYEIFPVKEWVRLIIETDEKTVSATGYVESNSVNIFSDKEGSQISILCESAWLTSWSTTDEDIFVYFVGVRDVFEFPFDNNSLTQDLIEFSEKYGETRQNAQYKGEVPTGFIGTCKINGEVRALSINNVTSNESLIIDDEKYKELVGTYMQSGDVITMNTITGQKSIKVVRDAVEYNLLPALDVDTKFPQLYSGVNDIWIRSEIGNNEIDFTLQYKNLYQGV